MGFLLVPPEALPSPPRKNPQILKNFEEVGPDEYVEKV